MKNNIKTDKNGLNLSIHSKILSDEEMKNIGFTDCNPSTWYYVKSVKFPKRYHDFDITFNVSIPKNGNRLRIDVLDEDFLQPYDYQDMLSNNNSFEPARIVYDFVENQMQYLQDKGVIYGHIKGEYI